MCTRLSDAFGRSPLHYAVEHGNAQQMQRLFQLGVGTALTSKDLEELLHLNASKHVRDQLLREVDLLDDVNYRLQRTHFSAQADCDADSDGEHATAIEPGMSVFLAAKLERDVTSLSGPLLQSPLLRAAMFGNVRAAELLLAKHADVTARDANGWTALHVRRFARFCAMCLIGG